MSFKHFVFLKFFRISIFLMLIILPCIKTNERPETSLSQQKRNKEDIEFRLTYLGEKLENLQNEAQEITRELFELNSPLKNLQADLNPTLEKTIENFKGNVKILTNATKILKSDVKGLKKNVSFLIKNSRLNLTKKKFSKRNVNELKNVLFEYSPLLPFCQISLQPSTNLPKNCKEVQESGQNHSGIYRIQPEYASKPLLVLCDLQTHGGGWTVIQNRFDGSQDFNQNWKEYQNGFGNLGGEFWIGLDTIHELTGYYVNDLYIELQDFKSQTRSAYYSEFSVGSEIEGYPLMILGGYSGDAGNSLLYHLGSKFTTKDFDQDAWSEGNCALSDGGAWWWRRCGRSNLNGKYLKGHVSERYMYQGMYWKGFQGPKYSLQRARMLVRPQVEKNMLHDSPVPQ